MYGWHSTSSVFLLPRKWCTNPKSQPLALQRMTFFSDHSMLMGRVSLPGLSVSQTVDVCPKRKKAKPSISCQAACSTALAWSSQNGCRTCHLHPRRTLKYRKSWTPEWLDTIGAMSPSEGSQHRDLPQSPPRSPSLSSFTTTTSLGNAHSEWHASFQIWKGRCGQWLRGIHPEGNSAGL